MRIFFAHFRKVPMFARGYGTDYWFFSPSTYGIFRHWMVWSKPKKTSNSVVIWGKPQQCWLVVTGTMVTMEFWMTFPENFGNGMSSSQLTNSLTPWFFRGVGLKGVNQQPDGYETYKKQYMNIYIYILYTWLQFIYIYMIIYDIWMCLKMGYDVCREPGIFLRGYHVFSEKFRHWAVVTLESFVCYISRLF